MPGPCSCIDILSIVLTTACSVPSPALPGGWLNWIIPFFKTPDTIVLNHGSLDGFFFLRFLKVLRNICLAGCLITFPVLFPIHATGGSGLTQLEMLTIGNVKDPQKLLAHVFVAWAFFGMTPEFFSARFPSLAVGVLRPD